MAYFRFEAKKCHLEVTASIQSAKKSTYAFQSLITNKKFFQKIRSKQSMNCEFFQLLFPGNWAQKLERLLSRYQVTSQPRQFQRTRTSKWREFKGGRNRSCLSISSRPSTNKAVVSDKIKAPTNYQQMAHRTVITL